MKKTKFLSMVAFALMTSAGVMSRTYVDSNEKLSELVMENIEVLAKEEGVVITCSSGITGRCFRKGCDVKYCGEYTYYQCEFSGYQRDYCTHPC